MTNVNRECPEYSKTQLLSDIGGAAGLMLGMSFASVIGIFEWVLTLLTNIVKARYVEFKKELRQVSTQ